MAVPKQSSLATYPYVDLNRYIGEWYEIARYPNRFEKNCVNTKAVYSLESDGNISVLNQCYDKSEGRIRVARGRAKVVEKKTNAKLRVTFFFPFSGDYWILDVSKNYEYAIVGQPSRKYLWILSRTKKMGEDILKQVLKKVESLGYNPENLIFTEQE